MVVVPSLVLVLVRRVMEVKDVMFSVIETPPVLAMAPVLSVETVFVTPVSMEMIVPTCAQVKVSVWPISVSVILVIWVTFVRASVTDMESVWQEFVCVMQTGMAVSVPAEDAPPVIQPWTVQPMVSVMHSLECVTVLLDGWVSFCS